MKIAMFPLRTVILAVLILTAGTSVQAQELLTNGDFEQDLATGWTLDTLLGLYPWLDTVDRATDFDPDADYEVRLTKYDYCYFRLYQTVPVTSLYLNFSVQAKMDAIETAPTLIYWAISSVALTYLDAGDNPLGETRIIYRSPHCPYVNTDYFHMIDAADTNWHDYSFIVNDELANLPGVNPAQIAKIRCALYDTTDGC